MKPVILVFHDVHTRAPGKCPANSSPLHEALMEDWFLTSMCWDHEGEKG